MIDISAYRVCHIIEQWHFHDAILINFCKIPFENIPVLTADVLTAEISILKIAHIC